MYLKRICTFLCISSLSMLAQNDLDTLKPIQDTGMVLINISKEIQLLDENYIAQSKEHKKIKGFRVQVYNGSKKDCLEQKSAFRIQYPEVGVYNIYEAPEYRIQAGNYRTRLEAEKALRIIRDYFPGSFIVGTEIEWPELEIKPIESKTE